MIYIGKITNTHGLKGELRIISNFEYKDKIFLINEYLYVGKEKLKIEAYRKHKIYDMVKFYDKNSIDDVEMYKGSSVYVGTLNLEENEILDADLVGFQTIYSGKKLGIISSVDNYGTKILRVDKLLIPYNEHFIEKIDKKCGIIYLRNLEGIVDEK